MLASYHSDYITDADVANYSQNGYGYLSNFLSEYERVRALEEIINVSLTDEGDNQYYKHSVGMGGLPYCQGLLNEKKHLIEKLLGKPLEVISNYARIYTNGNTMGIHTDREGLDIGISICIFNGFENDLCLIDRNGAERCVRINKCDGLVLNSRELSHYRRDIIAQNGKKLIMLFLHYTIV